jgi:hypothetical protein
VVLFALDKPLELLGNFQQEVIAAAPAHGFRALFTWSTFLDGGGGSVLALAFATSAIALGFRFTVGSVVTS